MDCNEAKLKINALIDNEIEEKDIDPLLEHLNACQSCRNYYKETLKVSREMNKIKIPDTSDEWYYSFRKKFLRKTGGILGRALFIGSYILLILYAFYQIFISREEKLAIKLILGGILAGIIILLGVTIADRIRESKHDKYKGVIR